MDPVDEREAHIQKFLVILPAKEPQEVADRESVRPEVTFGRGAGRFEPCQAGKVQHDRLNESGIGVSIHRPDLEAR